MKTIKYLERRVKANKYAKKIDRSDTAKRLNKYKWFKAVWKYRWRILVTYVLIKIIWEIGFIGFMTAVFIIK